MADDCPDPLSAGLQKYALTPNFCANRKDVGNGQKVPCLEFGSMVCSGCRLVPVSNHSTERPQPNEEFMASLLNVLMGSGTVLQ